MRPVVLLGHQLGCCCVIKLAPTAKDWGSALKYGSDELKNDIDILLAASETHIVEFILDAMNEW